MEQSSPRFADFYEVRVCITAKAPYGTAGASTMIVIVGVIVAAIWLDHVHAECSRFDRTRIQVGVSRVGNIIACSTLPPPSCSAAQCLAAQPA